MGLATNIFGWTIVIIVIIIAAVVAIMNSRQRIKAGIDKNLPFCLNLMPQLTDGRVVGLESKAVKAKNGRHVVDIIPMDYRHKEDKKIKLETKRMVVGNGNRIVLPEGELSAERSVVIYYPNSELEISERFSNTVLGKVLKEASMYNRLKEMFSEGLQQGDKALAKMVREWSKGEMSAEHLARTEEINRIQNKLLLSGVTQEQKKE